MASWPLTASGVLLATLAMAAGFEAPPAPFQTSPRPADGEVLAANPPCFVTPATAASAAGYTVECSPDEAFPPEQTRRWASPYMLVVPDAVLPPGEYHWRWRPADATDTAWSPVRRFTLPAGVPEVPFPDVAAWIQRIGTTRPRLLVQADRLEAVRREAAERFGPTWLKAAQATAERCRGQALLPEPEFLPETRDVKRIAIYQKIFQTTRPFMRDLATLAENYLLTGDALSGQEARRRLLHVVGWDPRGSTSLNHNDEPATEVLRYGPTAYDRVVDLLDDAERQRCRDCFMIRLQEMRQRWVERPFEKHPYESHNMGYYLPDLTEACLALAGEAPVEEMLRYALLQLWSPFFPPYGGAEGGWSEGPSYWSWSTARFARLYRHVEVTMGVPVLSRSHLRNMPWFKLYANPPYARRSPFGDGQEGAAGGGETMAILAALFDNPYAQWYADWQGARLGPEEALLCNAGRTATREPADLPQGRAFTDVGLAAMHTALPDPDQNAFLLFRSSPFGSISHAYADQNAFALEAYGEPLVIASGYYQLYGHPHHTQWTWQTKASNAVLVDGEGQSTRDWNARGRLLAFDTTAAADYALGDAHEAYAGRLERFLRHVLFLRPLHTGGLPVVVIRDDLAAARPATFQFLLHALEPMAVDGDARRLTIRNGAVRCRVDFLEPTALTFDQHDRFPEAPFRPAPNQWHLTAGTTTPATAAASLIVLQPYRDRDEDRLLTPRLHAGSAGPALVLAAPGRTVTVLLPGPDERPLRLGDLEAHGRWASLTLCDSQPRSAVLVGGRQLTWQGRDLLTGDRTATLSCTRWPDGRRLIEATATPGTNLTAALGTPEAWQQHADGPELRWQPGPEPLREAALALDAQAQRPFTIGRLPRLQQVTARADAPAFDGHAALDLTLANHGQGPLPISVRGGRTPALSRVLPGGAEETLHLPAVDLAGGAELVVTADESGAGRLGRLDATARPVTGVNLLPTALLENPANPATRTWQATSISGSARGEVAVLPDGREGRPCLKVTCIDPGTNGTFGAILRWPGLQPARRDRHFRMSCWVRTPPDAVAGLQVTSRDWNWWKNTERLGDRPAWTETALEFTLPAGTDLTHVRLHMTSQRPGAELFAADMALIELPAPPPAE